MQKIDRMMYISQLISTPQNQFLQNHPQLGDHNDEEKFYSMSDLMSEENPKDHEHFRDNEVLFLRVLAMHRANPQFFVLFWH